MQGGNPVGNSATLGGSSYDEVAAIAVQAPGFRSIPNIAFMTALYNSATTLAGQIGGKALVKEGNIKLSNIASADHIHIQWN